VEAKDGAKQQALEDGRSSNNAMQGILRNADPLKCELLELGELKRLGDVVREVASAESGDAKARREPEDRHRRRWRLQHLRPPNGADPAVNLLEVVEGGGSEPCIHSGGVVL
jgi:hypothetical protein